MMISLQSGVSKRRTDVVLLLVFIIAFLGCSNLYSQDKEEQGFSFDCPSLDGHTPEASVRQIIEKNEDRLIKWVLAGDKENLDALLADAMSYVHENGQVSTKEEFFRD